MTRSLLLSSIALLLLLGLFAGSTDAFTLPCSRQQRQQQQQQRVTTSLASDNVEQIEFKIYPDGRVEETVRGVKGNNCHKVTEKINESLGKVIASEPTEELYQNEVVLDQTLTNTVNDGGGDSSSDGGASWEGQSSW